MTQSTMFEWHKIAEQSKRAGLLNVSALVLLVVVAIGSAAVGYPLFAGAIVAVALTSSTVFVRPAPRIMVSGGTVEVLPRRAYANSSVVFPGMTFVAAFLVTVQWLLEPSGEDLRFPLIAGLFWLGTVVTAISAFQQRGNLLISSDSIAVGRHPAVRISDAQITVVLARKRSIPHIKLVDASGKGNDRLIFPEKYYALDANSVYSTVRHLAETDEATRRAYSPELIREMLLFKPDHDVPVGESIEVRIVAQPTATTS